MKYTLNELIHAKGITQTVQEAVMALRHENEELRAKIETMEKQEPVAWVRKLGLDLPSVVCVTDLTYRPSDTPKSSYIPLYLAPGEQPAPSIPEGWVLVPIEPTEEMKHAGRAAAWSNAVAYNETRDIYKAMLAAAPNEQSESPEANP